ncbi:MAG TPA: DUF1080 domain-containing protein [Terriglobales bacterium]|jgi:hypothetical protein|nr:DUF1080 domain-containing protein [Terriglobales bacterium]
MPDSGDLFTRQAFGDCQLHVEWASPAVGRGDSQARGNSGVFLMGLFEVQVLDTWQNPTYADGTTAAIYGQYPPLANATKPPGEWQTYDIFFRQARFEATGHLTKAARLTVVHNGVLVQDAVEPSGPTGFHDRPPYVATPDKLPLSLQDHHDPVRFRNIWIRELPAEQPALQASDLVPLRVRPEIYAEYAGHYAASSGQAAFDIAFDGKKLMLNNPNGRTVELLGITEDGFVARELPIRVFFTRENGKVTGVVFFWAGAYHAVSKTK